ncbi:S-layer homology domain-containing protein [Collinsella ihumii]|uniref:S-layer homology domain-containing protein n=1 Tax=Collinsella ihumii TaxID=1720204 RepID=A0AAW7JXH9_9ACTN|nr:S-layer homology domain-containing protein [Collinsella ihumii]MDN0068190.1 S-layer homology domain-containing protein [Collinsella ihumii]
MLPTITMFEGDDEMGMSIRRIIRTLAIVLTMIVCVPNLAFAADGSDKGYTVSTDWVSGTTTYSFTRTEDVNSVVADLEGDSILDFTKLNEFSEDTLYVTVRPQAADSTVTVVGNPNVTNRVSLTVKGCNTRLILKDFNNSANINFRDATGTLSLVYDGMCAIDQLVVDPACDSLNISASSQIAHLDLWFINDEIDLTLSGSITLKGSITCDKLTVHDAAIECTETDVSNDYRNFIASQIHIEDSSIDGISSITSFDYLTSDDSQDEFSTSSIAIKNSTIAFNANVFEGNTGTAVLGNSHTINIEGSTVYGINANLTGCLGGTFQEIIIKDSEVHAKSKKSAAIGPSDALYSRYDEMGIKNPSITIDNSVVEAASTYGSAIGMPWINPSSSTSIADACHLSISISGSSNVTATSIASAAIGSGAKVYTNKVPEDGVEIEVGAGDITWGETSSLSLLTSMLNLFGINSTSKAETDIVKATGLRDECSVTISGSPIINAKSGTMAIYAGTVSSPDTNVVQTTMVLADASGTYAPYAMETPGAVTTSNGGKIGELGYGYASVATTDIGAQDGALYYAGEALTNVDTGDNDFAIIESGIESFYATPTVGITGSIALTNSNGTALEGIAAVGTTLKVDLSGLKPSQAARTAHDGSFDGLTFTWYRNGQLITGEAGNTYKLTDSDNGAVVYCIVSGTGFFKGSVTSEAIVVSSETTVAAPQLASRTTSSITLQNAGAGYEYQLVGDNSTWQTNTTFEGLQPGTSYVFVQKNAAGLVSTPVTFMTVSGSPSKSAFTIDYVNETLSFPAGVNLYADSDCIDQLNGNSSKLSINISDLIGDTATNVFARYATADPTDLQSVTVITIPARPEGPTLDAAVITVTSSSISFTGESDVSYRLLANGTEVKRIEAGGTLATTFDNLEPSITYTLQARREASNSGSGNFRSNISSIDITTAAEAPEAPEFAVNAKRDGEGYQSVTVGFSWTTGSTNGATIKGYTILAKQKDGTDNPITIATVNSDQSTYETSTTATTALKPGQTYEFYLEVTWNAGEDSETSTVASNTATITLPNLLPDPSAFTIGYAAETLTVPEGVNLYADSACTEQITLDGQHTASITAYIAQANETPNSLYARYASADGDTEAVSEIEIPNRRSVSLNGLIDLDVSYNSIRIVDWASDKAEYELKRGDGTVEPTRQTSNETRINITWDGLEHSTTYILHKRVEAVEATGDNKGSFAAETSRDITTAYAETRTNTILIPAGTSETRQYDLSPLLDGANISTVREVDDPNSILFRCSKDTQNASAISLQLLIAEAGKTATIRVEAQQPDEGGYLFLDITIETVDALAESEDGTLWVRSALNDTQQEQIKQAIGITPDGDASLEAAFVLSPMNPVGGAGITDAAAQAIVFEFPSDSDIKVGAYSVYRIDPDSHSATKIDASKSDSSVTFTAKGTSAWYAITYTAPEPTSHAIVVEQTENGTVSVVQNAVAGETITVTPSPMQGFNLDALTITSNGTDVPATPNSDGTYTFTMPDADVRIVATFTAITPEAPTLSAQVGEEPGTIDVTWTQSTDNGAVITSYSLAVTSNDGQHVEGSPFAIKPDQSSYQLTGLTQGASYTLQLTSYNHDVSAISYAVSIDLPEPEEPEYTVNIAEGIENGSITTSPTMAQEGALVTITASPAEGYELDSVSVTDENGTSVTTAKQEDGTITFQMPASNVNVTAAFKQVETGEDIDDKDLNGKLDKVLDKADGQENVDAISLKTGAYELTDDLSVGSIADAHDVKLMTNTLYIGTAATPATVDLDLRGYSLDADTCAIIVTEDSTLNLYDSGSSATGDDIRVGTISGKTGLTYTEDGKTYVYAGGVGVYGTFNMFGGQISGNTATGDEGYGGGVYVFGGAAFNMYGGEISGNTASTMGGGVAVRSADDSAPAPNPMKVGEAEINDWETVDGGDITAEMSIDIALMSTPDTASFDSSDGTFNLYGGTISNNQAPVGAGVHVGGKVTVNADATSPQAITVTANKNDNLYVPAEKTIDLKEAPVSGSKIGVTMENGSGKFADSNAGTARNALASFTSDNGSYYVTSQSDGLALVVVPPPTYEPDVEIPSGGGSVTIDPRYPIEGDKVTITPVPDEGMTVDEVSVVDRDGEPIDLVDNGDGTWTYVQPADQVTITVTFVCDGGPLCPSAHLEDVDQSLWYHLSIDWAVTTGTFVGYDDGTFGPDNPLTRAEMATVLWRISDEPQRTYDLPEDCDPEAFYAEAVAWALAEEVFHGYGDGSTFGPDDPLTREQAACVLKNSADKLGIDTSARADLSGFPDADEVSEWAEESLAWAVASDILHGFELEDGTREIQPLRACTRAEMAALLMNLSEKA